MAATGNTNTEFELHGFQPHRAVCRDMAETVAWYEDKLGMRLVKTLGTARRRAVSTSSWTWATASTASPFSGSPSAPQRTPPGDSIHPTYDEEMERVGRAAG